jgi:hypothetical protein
MGTVDNRGLTVTRLSEDGIAMPGVLVASAAGTSFHLPRLIALSDSEVMVAWVDAAFSENSIVRVARSRDRGLTWTESPSLPVKGGLQSFDAVLRGGVLYVTGRQEGPWPFAAALRGNAWDVLEVPRGRNEIGIVSPRFSRAESEVVLYWGVNVESRVEREPPMLVDVRLAGHCRR